MTEVFKEKIKYQCDTVNFDICTILLKIVV